MSPTTFPITQQISTLRQKLCRKGHFAEHNANSANRNVEKHNPGAKRSDHIQHTCTSVARCPGGRSDGRGRRCRWAAVWLRTEPVDAETAPLIDDERSSDSSPGSANDSTDQGSEVTTPLPDPQLPDISLPVVELPNPRFPDIVFPEPGLPNPALPEIAIDRVAIGSSDDLVVFAVEADALFEFDSSELTPAARAVLDDVARAIETQTLSGPIDVAGHTDSIGTPAYNQQLSEDRADAVADYLGQIDDLAELIGTVEGFGESAPVASNTSPDGEDDPIGRARNRRVEIVVAR